MIHGAHVLFYSPDPEADRAFFRDVLGFRSVDAGGGWLIFGLPPSEAAFHPIEGEEPRLSHAGEAMLGAVLYLMCDDLHAEIRSLAAEGVRCGKLGLYQPRHPTALAS